MRNRMRGYCSMCNLRSIPAELAPDAYYPHRFTRYVITGFLRNYGESDANRDKPFKQFN